MGGVSSGINVLGGTEGGGLIRTSNIIINFNREITYRIQ